MWQQCYNIAELVTIHLLYRYSYVTDILLTLKYHLYQYWMTIDGSIKYLWKCNNSVAYLVMFSHQNHSALDKASVTLMPSLFSPFCNTQRIQGGQHPYFIGLNYIFTDCKISICSVIKVSLVVWIEIQISSKDFIGTFCHLNGLKTVLCACAKIYNKYDKINWRYTKT